VATFEGRLPKGPGQLTASRLEEYTGALHLEDLALACACEEGNEAAWEHFVATFRNYLYAAAAAITRRPASDPYAREFADSLYATLYSRGSGAGRSSLFHHFHGRSKLSTWLRAVLAQRYVDVLRQEKRFEQLEDEEGNERPAVVLKSVAAPLSDPERPRYVQYLAEALGEGISSLDQVDRSRLISYYLDEMTLAEIGKVTREHEATVSRKLERIRGELKERVFEILREGKTALNGQAARPGLSEAQIQLCLEYAAEEWPFDLGRVLSAGPSRSAKGLSLPDTAAKKD
jgi:RNA polymerase sigma-70 factor